ncbi:hypothetical protein BESB_034760 [Besnoitia besnoiti]|uniref:Uncharacterized protein n=1 Tax=Besnoitia besnoiti TaxID=94643 RepID=A0A2A9MES5_BESBE|nr:hypothetical protein BESB_034760 [Besnoitia besnoiti]PFH37018.1 hypothetical protein BESB_034760 [Besnoitia besnoiti]
MQLLSRKPNHGGRKATVENKVADEDPFGLEDLEWVAKEVGRDRILGRGEKPLPFVHRPFDAEFTLDDLRQFAEEVDAERQVNGEVSTSSKGDVQPAPPAHGEREAEKLRRDFEEWYKTYQRRESSQFGMGEKGAHADKKTRTEKATLVRNPKYALALGDYGESLHGVDGGVDPAVKTHADMREHPMYRLAFADCGDRVLGSTVDVNAEADEKTE